MTDAGMEVERRLKALRHARQAKEKLAALQRKWVLFAPDRLAAPDLGPVIEELERVAGTLADGGGNHWSVGPALRSCAQTLLDMGRPDLGEALSEAQLAYEEIMAQRPAGLR